MVLLGLFTLLTIGGGIVLLAFIVFLFLRGRQNQPSPGHQSDGWNPYTDTGAPPYVYVPDFESSPHVSGHAESPNPDAASQLDLTPPVTVSETTGSSDSSSFDSGGSSDSGSSSDSSSSSD